MALVVLGVSVLALGIGAGLVSAIQSDLAQAATQATPGAQGEEDEEGGPLAALMEQVDTPHERDTAPGLGSGPRSEAPPDHARTE